MFWLLWRLVVEVVAGGPPVDPTFLLVPGLPSPFGLSYSAHSLSSRPIFNIFYFLLFMGKWNLW